MHDFWLRHGKTLRYNAIKLRILALKQGEKKLRIFAEMDLKVLFIGWIKLLPRASAHSVCTRGGVLFHQKIFQTVSGKLSKAKMPDAVWHFCW